MAEVSPFGLKPAEALAYLRARGYRLDPSFAWQDVWQGEHTTAFTVAKSAGFDILDDIYKAVEAALAEGWSEEHFIRELRPLLKAKGWWGRGEALDPTTGERREAQLGSPRRLQTIFRTNMRMAHASAQWQLIVRQAHVFPYLHYITRDDDRVRHAHRAWHDLVLRWDDPWWNTHFPPNGWGCRCRVEQLRERDVTRLGLRISPRGPEGLPRRWINRRTGEMMDVPAGVAPGFAYNPGKVAAAEHAAALLAEGLVPKAPAVAATAMAAASAFFMPMVERSFAAWIAGIEQGLAAGTAQAQGARRIVGALAPAVLRDLERRGIAVSSGAISVGDAAIIHMRRDAKTDMGRAIALTDILRLPSLLNAPEAILWDRAKRNLLYVFTPTGSDPRLGKIAVAINYAARAAPEGGRPRQAVATNAVITAGLIDLRNLRDGNQYELIWGSL